MAGTRSRRGPARTPCTGSATTAQKYGFAPEDFPNAALCEDTTITLPIFPGMTGDEQERVAGVLAGALRARRRSGDLPAAARSIRAAVLNAGLEPGSQAEFGASTVEPLRVLHIGNIANNAYNNAKIQRRRGIEADVSCHDYFHIMGCPEWEDAEFEGDVVDDFFPDWWNVDLRGFERPEWFAQGRLADVRCGTSRRARPRRASARGAPRAALTVERWLSVPLDTRGPRARLPRRCRALDAFRRERRPRAPPQGTGRRASRSQARTR